ncbi:uncharacterized protein B0I36DRAFT_355147 [Microdochium trichocladiopsis]|uniref:Uncharacterized protein n=1 Tax=Microdochium trichocladiopsis TaxID=1682393 RepID=A0A9P8XWC9_9PEZI|nr:uncharacterized protein B0I36DRAFT_355147 [Microdochium trichocladiopsis]KAH7016340.1 hypothetical protein B0I36DRAFT_355147 [Microdochium trichocladiopsis]
MSRGNVRRDDYGLRKDLRQRLGFAEDIDETPEAFTERNNLIRALAQVRSLTKNLRYELDLNGFLQSELDRLVSLLEGQTSSATAPLGGLQFQLVEQAGEQPYCRENPNGVHYATPSHWLVRGWIPKACIVARLTLEEFEKYCVDNKVITKEEGVASFDPLSRLQLSELTLSPSRKEQCNVRDSAFVIEPS